MKTMKFAACAAMALAAAASGQTTPTSAEYEMRLLPPLGLPPDGTGTGTGGQFVLRFVVQARARTQAGTTNYGVNRWSSGTISGISNSTVTRASSSSAAAFGRFRPSGNGGAQNFARFQAAAGTGGTSATGVDANNVNGVVAGNSITGIDAYRGFMWSALEVFDSNGDQIASDDPRANPWGGTNPGAIGGPVTDGSWSEWQSLYAFTYVVPSFATQTITATGDLTIASSIQHVAGTWRFDQLPNATMASATYIIAFPTPGAAAALGLGALVAGRRRR